MPSSIPWRTVTRSLTKKQREAIHTGVLGLLKWQRDLRAWPSITGVPDATPFVSLYADGRLTGCFGSDEGRPGERLGRAFLRALEDLRYGGLSARDRPSLTAQVSYLRDPHDVSAKKVLKVLEPGTQGVALKIDELTALMLPQAARDEGLPAEPLLRTLAAKAGLDSDAWRHAKLTLFTTEDVAVRAGRVPASKVKPIDLALKWLARLIDEYGGVTFAIEGRARRHHIAGLMHHGRSAMVVQALAACDHAPRRVAKARRRLVDDIKSSLRGHVAAGWPEDPAMIVGTVALACLAGAKHKRDLLALIEGKHDAERHAWYAAQATLALGKDAPDRLWKACVKDLDKQPWAPWTALAAHGRGDNKVYGRCEKALVASIRKTGPHIGGARVTDIPECAQTAVAIEALRHSRTKAGRAAVKRAREFLLRWQHTPETISAALDPKLVTGAFPISPLVDVARCDVTAHAVLALRKDQRTR